MVHTIETRSLVEGVNVAGGLVNLDRGLGQNFSSGYHHEPDRDSYGGTTSKEVK